ncbi:MAG: GTPase ObgE [Magnetovibrio sp.]|nr:GTPase ObgE [Magnetovibrio sp.]
MKFLDEAKIYLKSGDGGDGCIGFRREKFVEFGGPDGGDGGRGGDIIFECVDGLNTLIDFRYKQHFKAKRGTDGMGRNRSGPRGADQLIKIPVGTQILDEDKKSVLLDFTEVGQKLILLNGGAGGFGNSHFKSSINQAPRKAKPGFPGKELWVWLRLKLIADAGIIGFPNAGKSTLLSMVSRAHPKIGDYPFTTLHPNLGVAFFQDNEFLIADLPGIIEGASAGYGLGTRFLGHAERCNVLIHLVDGTNNDIIQAYYVVRDELAGYGAGVPEKKEIIAISKCDALTKNTSIEKKISLQEATGKRVIMLSSFSQTGLDTLIRETYKIICNKSAECLKKISANIEQTGHG